MQPKPKFPPIEVGQIFGRLTVIGLNRKDAKCRKYYDVHCKCGLDFVACGSSLKRGRTKSCGCLRRQVSKQQGYKNKTHGHSYIDSKASPTYGSWVSMKQRCLNPKMARYSDYGGRGITVCGRWLKFENFLADMGERPENRSLDRIENDGNYEPSNCKWSTLSEQRNNRRKDKRTRNVK